MSQNNDWLAYEKSGSCRTDSLMHAAGRPGKFDKARSQLEHIREQREREKRIPGAMKIVQNTRNMVDKSSIVMWKNTAYEYYKRVEDGLKNLRNDVLRCEGAYRNRNLAKFKNAYDTAISDNNNLLSYINKFAEQTASIKSRVINAYNDNNNPYHDMVVELDKDITDKGNDLDKKYALIWPGKEKLDMLMTELKTDASKNSLKWKSIRNQHNNMVNDFNAKWEEFNNKKGS